MQLQADKSIGLIMKYVRMEEKKKDPHQENKTSENQPKNED